MYKKLPTNTRPLALEMPSKEFVKIWTSCIEDKKSDLTELLKAMNPVFDRWVKLFTSELHEDDINYLTLCKLISPDSDEAKKSLSIWLQYIEVNSDLKSELQYIFIERMRKFRYIPTLASNKMIEYIIAKDFKLGIHHHVRYILRLVSREALYHADIDTTIEIGISEEVPDYFLLKRINLDLTQWQSYLFFMIQQGYSSVKRSELTRIHRRNLYNEEQKIWHLIKQTL